ncbi:MAG: AI-2E family transporter [Clostridia bacterium]|nr:AI-2E family transporter [Clostridia bacterium]
MRFDRKTILKTVFGILAVFLIFCYRDIVLHGVFKISSAVSPVLFGLAAAYVLNIPMSFFEKHYFPKQKHKRVVQVTKRPVCITASVLSLVLLAFLIVYLVIPELLKCVLALTNEIPTMVDRVSQSEKIRTVLPEKTVSILRNVEWQAYIPKNTDILGGGIGNWWSVLLSAVTSLLSGIATFVIALVFAVYLLANKEKCIEGVKRFFRIYLPFSVSGRFSHIGYVLNKCFRGFIVGQCTEAIIIGVLCAIGMKLFGFPYAGMIGALVGFLALIPIVGAYIGAVAGSVMISTVSLFKGLMFLAFIVVLQQLEDNLIYPRVVGRKIGLPAFLVLAAITVGGSLFGILGMLLGVPLTASAYILLLEDMKKRETTTK